MKIAVIGATGRTGQFVVQQALEAGQQVVALVRNPQKMTTEHENLQVIKADVCSKESLEEAIKGCDGVLSCLMNSGPSLLTDSCKSATAAMRATGVSHYIVITGAGTKAVEGEGWYLGVLRFFFKKAATDMVNLEDYLEKDCADLKWTVVKPPILSMKPLDPRPLLAEEGQRVPNGLGKIPRANMAKFMLEQLTDNKWENKMVAIDLPK